MFYIVLPTVNYNSIEGVSNEEIDRCVNFTYDDVKGFNSFKDFASRGLLYKILTDQPELMIELETRFRVATKSVGNRAGTKVRNGTLDEQAAGIYIERVIKYLVRDHIEEDSNNYDEFDGGFDFTMNGVKVDIKTTGRNTMMNKDFSHNIMKSQVDGDMYKADCYLLASYNIKKKIITISGIIEKQEIALVSELHQHGNNVNNLTGKFKVSQDFYDIKDKQIKTRTLNLYDIYAITKSMNTTSLLNIKHFPNYYLDKVIHLADHYKRDYKDAKLLRDSSIYYNKNIVK